MTLLHGELAQADTG